MPAKHDIDLKVGVSGAEEFRRDTEKVGKATSRVGKQVGGVGEEVKKSATAWSRMADVALGAIKKIIAPLAGVGGLLMVMRAIRQETQETAAALKMLGDNAAGIDKASAALAQQFGMVGTKGQAVSKGVLTQLMKSGRFVDDFEAAKTIGIASHVAYGEAGQPLSGEGLSIANLVASFSGAKQIGGSTAGDLVKVLGLAGVQTREQAGKRLGQLSGVYEKAYATDWQAFAGGLQQFMPNYISRGGTYESGLAMYGRAVKVTKSEAAGGSMVEKMARLTLNPDILAMASGREGISVQKLAAMPLDVQMGIVGKHVAAISNTPEGSLMLAEAGFAKREVGWGQSMFGSGGIEEQQGFQNIMAGATTTKTEAELKKYWGSEYGQRLGYQTGTSLLAASALESTKRGGDMIARAAAARSKMIEGTIPWELNKPQRLAFSAERQTRSIAYGRMYDRLRNIAREMGVPWEDVKEDPRTADLWTGITELQPWMSGLGGFSEVNQRELGEMGTRLSSYPGGGPITINTGVTYNFSDREGDMKDPGTNGPGNQ